MRERETYRQRDRYRAGDRFKVRDQDKILCTEPEIDSASERSALK